MYEEARDFLIPTGQTSWAKSSDILVVSYFLCNEGLKQALDLRLYVQMFSLPHIIGESVVFFLFLSSPQPDRASVIAQSIPTQPSKQRSRLLAKPTTKSSW